MSNRIAPEVIRIPINAAQQRRLDTLGQQMDTIMQRRSEAVSAIIEGTMPLDGLEKHHLAIEPGFIVLHAAARHLGERQTQVPGLKL